MRVNTCLFMCICVRERVQALRTDAYITSLICPTCNTAVPFVAVFPSAVCYHSAELDILEPDFDTQPAGTGLHLLHTQLK